MKYAGWVRSIGVGCSIVVAGGVYGAVVAPEEPLSLWYRQPAKEWVEALPIGNGRLGAMVFGGIGQERLQLNEDTLWAGGPYDPLNPEAKDALPEVQALVFDGKYAEAAKLIDRKVMARPIKQMQYQPAGDLLLDFPHGGSVENYRRELNLDTAVATTSYTIDGVRYTREVFSSPVDQVIVVKLSSDKPGKIDFKASLETPQKASVRVENGNTLVLDGRNGDAHGIEGKLKFQVRANVVASGGAVSKDDNSVQVKGADSAVILLATATSYKRFDDVSGDPEAIAKKQIASIRGKSHDQLLADHVAEHQRLFRRVALDLGGEAATKIPTDERIRRFPDADDPQFAVLYFQYGRYLLISSSRPGSQPANLQGIWNDKMTPPWDSKYTININTEMNYWPAEPGNLAECVEPLVAMLEELSVTGAKTAKEMYGARGWVVHHNTDLWRASAPIDGATWGMWPLGGAWLCTHLWEHYEFSGDKVFLARVYPIMKGSALFFVDTLVEDPKSGYLVTNPSSSPENSHPFGASVCAGPTMDNADPARPVYPLHPGVGDPRRRYGFAQGAGSQARPAGAQYDRQAGPVAGVAGGLGCRCAGTDPSAHFASVRALSQRPDHRARHARTGRSNQGDAGDARRHFHRLGHRLANQLLGAAARRRPYAQHHQASVQSATHLSKHVRRASAVPDRRQLRW
jgi:alpha-L-fucosidase 2